MPHKYSLLVLALLAAGCAPTAAPTVIVVEARYPGANAQTVAETIAVHIEQQVNGVEKAQVLRSRCTNDGRYTLRIVFAPGTDAATAQVLVQNRLGLAMPLLPIEVQHNGLTAIKAPADVRFIAVLSSPAGRYDTQWMGNYAAVKLKDELARLQGVGAVTPLPEPEAHIVRVHLDREKLGKSGLAVADIVEALKAQNIRVLKAPPKGAEAGTIDLDANGRLMEPDQFGDIILKVNAQQDLVRLRDVGSVKQVDLRRDQFAQLNGKEVVLLCIAPVVTGSPGSLKDAVSSRLTDLAKQLPDGLRLELAFDFTANVEHPGQRAVPEYLLLDVDLPARASSERTIETLRKCGAALAKVDGVQDVLTLSSNPFDTTRDRPSILVRLTPARQRKANRDEVAATIRIALHETVPDAGVRVRFPLGAAPFTGWGYPLDLAIHGPEAPEVRTFAGKLAERMRREKQLTDVWLDPAGEPQRQFDVHVDRQQAARHGVAVPDIYEALQAHGLGGTLPEDVKQLKIRNSEGKMVPLAEMVKVRETKGPAAVDRFDLRPMAEITANPAVGVSLADARALCEKRAREVREELQLPADYRLSRLREPAAK